MRGTFFARAEEKFNLQAKAEGRGWVGCVIHNKVRKSEDLCDGNHVQKGVPRQHSRGDISFIFDS